jgi:hypothetical protein
MTDYIRYVDYADGDDANLGTAPGAGNAWQTVRKAIFTSPPTVGVGDTYQVWVANGDNARDSGIVEFDAALSGGATTIAASAGQARYQLGGAEGIRVDDALAGSITVRDMDWAGNSYAINWWSGDHTADLLIEDSKFASTGGDSLFIRMGGTTHEHDVTLRDCELIASGNSQSLIHVATSASGALTIDHCDLQLTKANSYDVISLDNKVGGDLTLTDNTFIVPLASGQSFWVANPTNTGAAAAWTIARNRFKTNTSGFPTTLPVIRFNDLTAASTHPITLTFEDNRVDCDTTMRAVQLGVTDTGDLPRYRYVASMTGLWAAASVQRNHITNAGGATGAGGALYVGPGFEDSEIAENRLFSGWDAHGFQIAADGCTVHHNISYGHWPLLLFASHLTAHHNTIYATSKNACMVGCPATEGWRTPTGSVIHHNLFVTADNGVSDYGAFSDYGYSGDTDYTNQRSFTHRLYANNYVALSGASVAVLGEAGDTIATIAQLQNYWRTGNIIGSGTTPHCWMHPDNDSDSISRNPQFADITLQNRVGFTPTNANLWFGDGDFVGAVPPARSGYTAVDPVGPLKLYVDAAALDDNDDGLSWGSAKKTITAAITAAADSSTIFAKAGTYAETVDLSGTNGVTLAGDGDTTIITSAHASATLTCGPGTHLVRLKVVNSGTAAAIDSYQAVQATSCPHLQCEYVTTESSSRGFALADCVDFSIRQCHVTGKSQGIDLASGSHGQIEKTYSFVDSLPFDGIMAAFHVGTNAVVTLTDCSGKVQLISGSASRIATCLRVSAATARARAVRCDFEAITLLATTWHRKVHCLNGVMALEACSFEGSGSVPDTPSTDYDLYVDGGVLQATATPVTASKAYTTGGGTVQVAAEAGSDYDTLKTISDGQTTGVWDVAASGAVTAGSMGEKVWEMYESMQAQSPEHQYQRVIYAAQSGTGLASNTGLSRRAPMDLTTAWATASGAGEALHMMEGTYPVTSTLTAFAGVTYRGDGPNKTILSGQMAVTAHVVETTAYNAFENFAIIDDDSSAALFGLGPDPAGTTNFHETTLRNMRFRCKSDDVAIVSSTAGVRRIVADHCVFEGSWDSWTTIVAAGHMYSLLRNCTFRNQDWNVFSTTAGADAVAVTVTESCQFPGPAASGSYDSAPYRLVGNGGTNIAIGLKCNLTPAMVSNRTADVSINAISGDTPRAYLVDCTYAESRISPSGTVVASDYPTLLRTVCPVVASGTDFVRPMLMAAQARMVGSDPPAPAADGVQADITSLAAQPIASGAGLNWTTFFDNSATPTTNVVDNVGAIASGSVSAENITDISAAVWAVAASGVTTSGSTGAALNSTKTKTDLIRTSTITSVMPVQADGTVVIIRGDTYSGSRVLSWTDASNADDLTDGVLTFHTIPYTDYRAGTGTTEIMATGTITALASGYRYDMPLTSVQTTSLTPNIKHMYNLKVEASGGEITTYALGVLQVDNDVSDA